MEHGRTPPRRRATSRPLRLAPPWWDWHTEEWVQLAWALVKMAGLLLLLGGLLGGLWTLVRFLVWLGHRS
jgi:hypothetical protein